jgi:hypothetical protein
MLNSFQHLIKSTDYETLNQVQGDTNRFGQHALDFPLTADYELMLRFLYKHGVSTAYIPKVLVNPIRKALCGSLLTG